MKDRYFIFNDKEHFRRFCWGIVFLAFFCTLGALLMQKAFAAGPSAGFTCSVNAQGIGQASGSANLFTTGGDNNSSNAVGTATGGSGTVGTGAIADPCANVTGFFGRMICFFKTTVGQVMASMYCGFQAQFAGPLRVALTLVVVVFGIAIITGMANFTVKEAAGLLLKIALVWIFATNADWGIGIAYKFFMGLAEGGTNIVLGALTPAGGTAASINQPDTVLNSFFSFSSGDTTTPPAFATTLTPYCATALIAMLVLFLAAVPIIVIFIGLLLLLYIGLYARALLWYLAALVIISFLIILSPLFLSFLLFATTRPLFEQWIKYLTTYSIQMIVVFAFLAMLQLVPLGAFFFGDPANPTTSPGLLGMIREYDITIGAWHIHTPFHGCSICNYTINATSTPPTMMCNTAAPAAPTDTVKATDGSYVIPFLSLVSHQDFLLFVVSQIFALWIIGHVMEDFLKKAPELAKQLGGLPLAAAFAGGASAAGGPAINFIGMQSIAAGYVGFKNKFTRGGLRAQLDPHIWSRRIVESVIGEKKTYKDEHNIIHTYRAGGAIQGFLQGEGDMHSAQAQEREVNIKQSERRLAALNKKYDLAIDLKKKNEDDMKAVLAEVESLKASHTTSSEELESALKRLKAAHKNFDLAIENEHTGSRRLIEENTRFTDLKNQRVSSDLRGILASSDKAETTGKTFTIHEGSILEGLFVHAKDDEVLKEIAESRGKRQEEALYGHELKKGDILGEGMYGFLKTPEGVAAGEDTTVPTHLRDHAKSIITNLNMKLSAASHFLPPEKIQEIKNMISSVEGTVDNSNSQRALDQAISQLEAAGRMMS